MPLSDAEKVALARRSLAFYIGWAHKTDMESVSDGQAVPRAHHLQIIERMQDVAAIVLRLPGWKDAGQERHTAIVAPPGSAKTTLLQGFEEWIIGLASLYWADNWADMIHLGHISHSADQAWRMSFAVRETIENNDVFKACFPKVKASGKWAEKEWRIEGCIGIHPTFAALGIEGSIPGFRWNFLGLDDLIKPEAVKESNLTPTEVEAIIYTVQNVAMERLVEGGCAMLTNTRWFERDPTSWAVKEQHWTPIVIKALDENDESFWPDRQIFATETLLEKRQRDPEGFALQYMGEAAPASGITFKADYFRDPYDQVPWKDAEDKLNFVVVDSWDTAGTINKRSDYTAGWTAAVDLRSWDVYLLNLYHGKVQFEGVLDAIRGSHMGALQPQLIWLEDAATGQPAGQLLHKEGIPIIPVRAYGERGQPRLLDVINQIKPMLASGRVHMPSERFAVAHGLGWLGEALLALMRYPRGQHDDITRAFIQLLYETLKLQQDAGIYDPKQEEIAWGMPEGERLRV